MGETVFVIDEAVVHASGVYVADKQSLVTEASDALLEPGYWPALVAVSGKVYRRTNDNAVSAGELLAVRYAAADGQRLVIFND